MPTEPKANYKGPELGPFKCWYCKKFERPCYCGDESIRADADAGLLPIIDGRVLVHPWGICDKFDKAPQPPKHRRKVSLYSYLVEE